MVARSRSGYAEWPVSQDGRVFAVCAPIRRGRHRLVAKVTVVDARQGLSVDSARSTTNITDLGPDCVASNAGTATMTVIRRRKARRKFTTIGVTVGRRGTPRFSLPGGTRDHGIGLETVSPDGKQVVTRFDVPEATVIQTVTGRHSRAFRPSRGGWIGFPLAGVWEGVPAITWSPFAPAVVKVGRRAVEVFNPRTFRSSRLLRITSHRGGARPCFLPSGRVLVAVSRDVESPRQELFVTNRQRTRVKRIDTGQLGSPSSVSCEAAGIAGKVFVATTAGRVFEVTAEAIDGSPFVPATPGVTATTR